MYPWLNAFIDESGTNALESGKPNTSHLFICVAVLVEENNIQLVREGIKSISDNFNNGSEIKSSKIGPNFSRRIKFLNIVRELPFTFVSLIVNKNNIHKDSGLKFKPTYYKYISRLLYNRIVSDNYNLRIIADEIGSVEYINSVESYFNERKFPDLFTKVDYSMCNSQDEPLIQLADLIAGSLTYCFDENKDISHKDEIWDLLKNQEIGTCCWPLNIKPQLESSFNIDDELNTYFKECAKRKAISFIEKYEDSTKAEEVMQARVVSFLLFAQQFTQNDKVLTAEKLITRLNAEGFSIERQVFSSSIVGKIRDAGVIISGTHNGYSLALSFEEIKGYLEHNKTVIEPMLWRLKVADETVRSFLHNKCNMLDTPPYKLLSELLDCYKKFTIETHVKKNK